MAVQLVDEWGRGFVAETDYRLEARNTIEFDASMKARGTSTALHYCDITSSYHYLFLR